MNPLKLAFPLLLVALSACKTPPPAPAVAAKGADPAQSSLDAILKGKPGVVNPSASGPEAAVAVPVYGDKTSVSFMGDASTLLANAAKARGAEWKYELAGPQPRLPIYVQINVKNVSFVDFLQNIAGQLGQRADIELSDKRLTLRYRAAN